MRPNSKLNLFSQRERKEMTSKLYDQQDGKCYICENAINLGLNPVDIDHIKAISLGGMDDENNFGLTHSYCNRSKGIRDLQLQKYIYLLNTHIKKYTDIEGGGNFTVKEALQEFAPKREDLTIKLEDGKAQLTFEKNGEFVTKEYLILQDLNNESMKSIIALIPIKYIYHDETINPRSIVDLEPMIEEFYNKNPQLQPSLALCSFSGKEDKTKIFLFDGQHKAAAQMYIGNKEIFVRIFLNADRARLKETNFRAHTKLAQIHFPQLIADKVGYDIFFESFNAFKVKMTGVSTSEKGFIEQFSLQARREYKDYLRNYLQYRVLTETAYGEKNKLMNYLETVSARSKRYPLSYETLQKTFFRFLFSKPAIESLSITEEYRELEKNNLIKLMSVFAEEVLIEKYKVSMGIFKIEEQLAENPEKIPLDHLRAYRMCRAAPMVIWTTELKEAISQLLNLNNRYDTSNWKRDRILWAEIVDSDWSKIRKMIKIIAEQKIWIEKINSDIVKSVASNKQNDWRSILLDGKLPGREERIYNPLDASHIIKLL